MRFCGQDYFFGLSLLAWVGFTTKYSLSHTRSQTNDPGIFLLKSID